MRIGNCVMVETSTLIGGSVEPNIPVIRNEIATPAMMPPVIITTSKNRATAVMGAPMIASWTEPTNDSPDSRTTTPAAMTNDGRILIPSWS